MPPGVSGVLLEIMLSCDTCCIYLSLCVLANKGVHYLKEVHSTSHCLNPVLPSEPAEMQFGADSGGACARVLDGESTLVPPGEYC